MREREASHAGVGEGEDIARAGWGKTCRDNGGSKGGDVMELVVGGEGVRIRIFSNFYFSFFCKGNEGI